MSAKKTILLFTDWYDPGFKAGGPIQSCRNIVRELSDYYRFYIVTSDRDLGDERGYEGIQPDQWLKKNEDVSVYYASRGVLDMRKLRRIIHQLHPDVIYLNSMFSLQFTLKPLWLLKRMNYPGRIVLAPRGMLRLSALAQKPLKKKLFLKFASIASLGKSLIFHATDEQEQSDIKARFGNTADVVLAPNLPTGNLVRKIRSKTPGELRIVYISRIHPVKNLLFALDVLRQLPVNGGIGFDIYGATGDENYYRACFEAARQLEKKMQIQFFGEVPHEEVAALLAEYQLFFLPTTGENFGHAIFEALATGCPVLISDQTPWKDLESSHAGWTYSLAEASKFIDVITRLYNMEQDEYDKWSAGAYLYAKSYITDKSPRQRYLELFGEER